MCSIRPTIRLIDLKRGKGTSSRLGDLHSRISAKYLLLYLRLKGLGTAIASIMKTQKMKKILIGALVCAAVAGVVYYLQDPDRFSEKVDDLANKGKDALKKAKEELARATKGAEESMQQA
jgi:hypothetical protein